MSNKIDYNSGIVSIPSFTSPLGVFIRSGQRVKTVNTGNIYAVLRNVNGSELLSDVVEIDTLSNAGGGGGGSMTDEEVKIAYENNDDTNDFDDAEKAKLATLTVAVMEVVANILKEVDPSLSNVFDYTSDLEAFSAEGDNITGDYTNKTLGINYSSGAWLGDLSDINIASGKSQTQSGGWGVGVVFYLFNID